jgi:hypothetical protein
MLEKLYQLWTLISPYIRRFAKKAPPENPHTNEAGNATKSAASIGHVVVFIHGLGGNAQGTWLEFPALLGTDAELRLQPERVASFEYPTGLTEASRLDAHVLKLEQCIDALNRASPITSLTLIAHSQGGLLARRYLNQQLDRKKRGETQTTPLFRLLTYATPHWGAFSSYLQKPITQIKSIPSQIQDLGYDASAILQLNQEWARLQGDQHVDMLRVIAQDDWVVPEFSALDANYQHHHRIVPGHGHISIVKVKDREHPSYGIAKEFLRRPLSTLPYMLNADSTVPVLKHGLLKSDDIANESQRLLYLARWVPLLGRETEWCALEQFIQHPQREDQKPIATVAWLWMEGIGGVGKSRLALELCLALQETDWHTGFLSRDSDTQPDWTRWQPSLPTLMVVDYASTDLPYLARLLNGLCQRDTGHELRHPVRLLLLDRPDQQERLEQSIGTRASHAHIHNARHHPTTTATNCLALTAVEDAWSLVQAYTQRLKPSLVLPDRDTALQALKALDPQARPLYALMVADALAAGVDIATLNQGRTQILSAFLRREQEQFWVPAARKAGLPWSAMEPYLVAATAMSGLHKTQLAQGRLGQRIPVWPDAARAVFKDVTGYDPSLSKISPLQPDLLGEYWVIQFWKNLDAPDRQLWMDALIETAPLETMVFLDRLGQDFPAELELAVNAAEIPLETPISRLMWAAWFMNFTSQQYAYCTPYLADLPKKLYSKLSALTTAHPSEPALRLRQANAAFNLISHLGMKQPEEAKKIYQELCELATAPPNEPALRLQQAKAAVNLINHLGMKQPEEAKKIYQELCALATAHPSEPELRLRQAKAALNLTWDLGGQQPEEAKKIYQELCALATAHPSEPV